MLIGHTNNRGNAIHLQIAPIFALSLRTPSPRFSKRYKNSQNRDFFRTSLGGNFHRSSETLHVPVPIPQRNARFPPFPHFEDLPRGNVHQLHAVQPVRNRDETPRGTAPDPRALPFVVRQFETGAHGFGFGDGFPFLHFGLVPPPPR